MDESFFAEIPREYETLEEVLNSVEKEQQDIVEETPAESQPEKPQSSDEDLKRNEAWKRIREERDAERRAREELEQRLNKLESERKNNEEVEQPEFLTDMIGENREIAQKFKSYENELASKIKQQLIQEQIEAQQKQLQEKEYWNKWTEERLAEVESEFNVNFKTDETLKNELSKIMLDYSPTDEYGNLDYKKGMKILSEFKKINEIEEIKSTKVKKSIADTTVTKETTSKPSKDYLTREDLRGGWRSIINR